MELIPAPQEKSRRFGRWFARRVITYVVVCSFLAFVNYMTSPHTWWVLWVMAGWGIGILLPLAYYLMGCDDESDYKNC